MEEQPFKVLWLCKSTGVLRTFIFDNYYDDKQNQRYIFEDNEQDKVCTIHYDDVGYLITAPYKPNYEDD